MNLQDPKTRKWIYNIITAAIPVLVLLGFVSDEIAASIMNLVAAVLAVGGFQLASANVPDGEDSLSD